MRGRDRNRRPGRREPFRDPRPIILIVCEGAVTERQYVEKFAIYHRNSRLRLKVGDETGVPLSLVRAAKQYKVESEDDARRQRDQNLAFDSVWCVFDIDEHPNVHEAKDMAAANGIGLAISNPCFELWLLLHLRDGPGMNNRHEIQRLLKGLIADYDKQVDFDRYANGYEEAVARAKRLDALARQIGDAGRNPTTNVYELTELILKGKE